MHELCVALDILDVAAEEAQRRGCRRVAAVHLRLGPLSGVVKDALLAAYDLAREGSALEGARLVIEEIPLAVYCPTCAGERVVCDLQLVCPVCATPTPEVRRGRELEIVALEVEA